MKAIYQIGSGILGEGISESAAIEDALNYGYEIELSEVKTYRKGQTPVGDLVWVDLPAGFGSEDEDDILAHA